MIVLDASMALAWLLPRVEPSEAVLAERLLDQIEDEEFLVPAVWYAEISNAVLRAERKGLVLATQATSFLAELAASGIGLDTDHPKSRQVAVIALSRGHGLTAYDATYLELALRTGGALATFDQQLAQAARNAGSRVFGDAP